MSKPGGSISYIRAYISTNAFYALQDIFLAYNMFFILDDSKGPDLIRDEARQITYAVKDVIDINISASTLQDDSEKSDSEEEEESDHSISDRMFD